MWNNICRNENGKLHCTDGPALEHCKGGIVCFLDGNRFDDFGEWCKVWENLMKNRSSSSSNLAPS